MSPAPRALRDLVILLVAVLAALVASPATADDTTAAWAVAPSDAEGAPTGQTRFELEIAPGETVTEHVLITNSSTVERAFEVYGADGFNTPTGGYDLDVAAVEPTDVGSWITVAASPVTVPALSTAVVELTIAVPDGAAPGDHPGGVVVSPLRGQVTSDGVVVDTRVAVRLNVRVPGEITAALDVRDASATFGFTAVPFASAPATIAYEVVNSGNVKVVGEPRLRVTGPFGITLADVEAETTHEVLPGDSFTVSTEVPGIAPLLLATAVIDVEMAAAPGPATDLPLVTSSARVMFPAIPWTGLAVLAALALIAWFVVTAVRRRRREGEQLWDRVVDEARADLEAGRAPRTQAAGGAAGAALAVAVAGWLVLAGSPPASAADTDDGSITITVPKASATPTPTPSTTASSSSARPSAVSAGSATATPIGGDAAEQVDAAATADDGADTSAGAVPEPDLVWSAPGRGWGPVQWSLLGIGGLGGGGLLFWLVRWFLAARAGAAA